MIPVPMTPFTGFYIASVTAFASRFLTCTIVACLPLDADYYVIATTEFHFGDQTMSDIKAIVRATGTVTYDETQFGRLKALFDELGVKYEVLTDGPRTPTDFMVKPGEKWLMTDAGKGYSSYWAAYGFTVDGRFLGYFVGD